MPSTLYGIPPLLRAATLVVVLLAPVFVPPAFAAPLLPPVITEIRYVGNQVTRPSVMRQEVTLQPGDRIDFKEIHISRRALMNLGLFKRVRARLDAEPDGYVLIFEVEEKYYVLPVPRLDAKPEGAYSYGLELRLDNLNGLNQRLRTFYRTKDHVDGDRTRSKEIAVRYLYPRIVGTPYSLDVAADLDRSAQSRTDETGRTGRYELDDLDVGFRLSRWLDPKPPTRGWRYGGGLELEKRAYSHLGGVQGLTSDGRAVALTGQLEFIDVEEHRFYFEGKRFGYLLETGSPQLGSDFSFTRHFLYYKRYMPLPFRDYANFNWQLRLGAARGHPFGRDAHSLGGSGNLRGYADKSASGNALLLANMEYLHPLLGRRNVRGALFVDAGNVYPEVDDIDPTELKAGFGAGLRWELESFVDVTLTIDLAWGPADDNREVYASTSRPF